MSVSVREEGVGYLCYVRVWGVVCSSYTCMCSCILQPTHKHTCMYLGKYFGVANDNQSILCSSEGNV